MFAVFKDDLATRKSLKAFFLQPINTKYSSESFFLSIYGELNSTKGFLKFYKLVSKVILGQISVSVKS